MRTQTTRGAHVHTAREAGFGRISPLSVLAGVVSAYGAFAIIAAIAGAILTEVDVDTEFRTNDWTGSGAVAALVTAGVLFLAYLFGGYVAGRMARRAGILHGVLVFIVSLVVGGVVGGVVSAISDNAEVEENLRSIGVPTTTDQISEVAIAAVIVSLVAVLLGSLLGGMLGERWHTKLARRAADPEIGPAATLRDEADREDDRRDERIARDEALRRDVERDDTIDLRRDEDEPQYTESELQERESVRHNGGGTRL